MEFLKVENSHFSRNWQLKCGGKLYTMDRPWVMGIVNCTPDSFYEKSQLNTFDKIKYTIDKHVIEGAEIIDIGGYSTRPGATQISVDEELSRIMPALDYCKLQHPSVLISIDTFRAKIALETIQNGAHLINDISGGTLDPEMFKTISELDCPYILMHMRGTPETMQNQTDYNNIFVDVCHFLSQQADLAKKAGIKDIILDPGFGFAKTLEQNYELFKQIDQFKCFDFPFLIGISRKSMLYKAFNSTPEETLAATSALNLFAVQNGAKILRVHDVKEAKEVCKLADYLSK